MSTELSLVLGLCVYPYMWTFILLSILANMMKKEGHIGVSRVWSAQVRAVIACGL